jgi:nitrogen fixation protein NifT
MKVMLRRNSIGHLVVYVAKKDLEEEVIEQQATEDSTIVTLANGWELSLPPLLESMTLPKTVEAKRL